ncbi:MAG: M20/M25/M40 family metallo-hydrolase [Planctomycetota bacterium]
MNKSHWTSIVFVISTIALGTLGFAAGMQAPQTGREAPPTVARFRYDVGYLASHVLEGRKAGTQAADEAADFISRRFERLGLSPAGTAGNYLQSFALLHARKVKKDYQTSILPAFITSREELAKYCIPTLASSTDAAEGAIVDTGNGDDYKDPLWETTKDGKALIALVHYKPNAPKENVANNPHAGETTVRTLAFSARQKGAKGLICIVEKPEDVPFDSGEDRDVGIPVLFILEKGRPLILENRERFGFDSGVEKLERKTNNVLALVPSPKPNTETIVVGAHYDHLGWGGSASLSPADRAIHHGADDNASGTALMLELARRFALRAAELERSVLFAAWGAEEMGLLGSKHWVENPTVPLDRVAAKINFDMVGRSNGRRLTIMGSSSSPAFEGFVQKVNDASKNPLNLSVLKTLTMMGGSSDHQSFLLKKKPALFFFTGTHTDYHKPTDTSEKVDYYTMAEIADLAEQTILNLSKLPKIEWSNIQIEEPTASAPEGSSRRKGTWLGTIPDYSAEEGGLVLSGTSAGSPAQKAGMLAKDILTKVGEYPIRDAQDLTLALRNLKPGQEVVVEYKRNGEAKKLTLTLAERK